MIVKDIALDCNATEDELARVREELGHAQYLANLKVQEVARERDALREALSVEKEAHEATWSLRKKNLEELESARRVINAAWKVRMNGSPGGYGKASVRSEDATHLSGCLDTHHARFGGRE